MGQGYSLAALSAGSAGIDVPELADLTYEKSLGNGRLMKCVRAMRKDGLVIAKVVMKPYASFTLARYVKQLQAERIALADVPNALSYHRIIETSANGFLVRQYIHSSLYDRMSTRPFLDDIEKKWISYQLLCAVRDCHAKNIYHGDIKTENLLVTSWNWLYLCDFSSSFKPTYLPEDNPADFSFFFDTAGRRTCYLAPERFLLPGQGADGKSPINWAMDMFSVGCVIAELFLERPIFNLSQLFKYRANKEYDPVRLHLSRINDENVREMILHLIELDPQDRYSAEETLNFSRGKVFPEYFQTFLHQYMHVITDPTSGRQPITAGSENLGEADERIEKVYYDFDKISYALEYSNSQSLRHKPRLDDHLFPLQVDIPGYRHEITEKESTTVDDGTLIFLALVTSQLQRTARAAARVKACELLLAFAERSTDETKLDRIVPLLVALLSDKTDRVKVAALRALTQVLELVKVVTPINANVFYDYLIPRLEPFILGSKSKPSPWVRATYASCLGSLAMTAQRYFDMVQALRMEGTVPSTDPETEDGGMTASVFETYDSVRRAVVQQMENQTKIILTDNDLMTRRAFLSSIGQLCVFFGSTQANEVLLSHLNTYLNDKSWLLRCDFFQTMISVAFFTGTAGFEEFMLPLMVQALTDSEETVVERVLRSLSTIAGAGLIQRSGIWELIDIVGRFLIHPNLWIREAAAAFFESSSTYLSLADIRCIVLPLLRPYLKVNPSDLKATSLLQWINKPFPRACLSMASDWALKTEKGVFWKPVQKPRIFSFNQSDNVIPTTSGRDLGQQAFDRTPRNDEDEMWLTRLRNIGMAKDDEIKLLALREYIFRVAHRSKSNDSSSEAPTLNGVLALSELNISPQTVFFDQDEDLFRYNRTQRQLRTGEPRTISEALRDAQLENPGNIRTGGIDSRRQSLQVQTHTSLQPPMRDDESIYSDSTAVGHHHHGLRRKSSALGLIGRAETGKAAAEISTTPSTAIGTMGAGSAQTRGTKQDSSDKSHGSGREIGRRGPSQRSAHTYTGHDPSVLNLLDSLYMDNYPSDNLDFGPRVDNTVRLPIQRANGSSPAGGWAPEGHMIAMLAEHTASVNRLAVAPDHSFFISGSDDGSVKVWNTARLEKHVSYRARRSHQHAAGVRVTSLCFIENTYCFVSTGSDGSVHVVRVDPGDTARSASLRLVREFKLPNDQYAVWTEHYKSEVQSILVLATNKSRIVGLELRTMQISFDLANPLHHGTPTCFCIDRKHHWLLLGTTHGVLDLWDLRFKLRVKSWVFQGGSQIHRMYLTRRNRVTIAGGTNTGEITTWEIEKAGLREVYRVANYAPKDADKYPKLIELDDDGPGSMLRRFKGTSGVTIDGNSGTKSTDYDRGVNAIAIGSHYTGDQDRVRHHFVVSAGPDRKVRFWDSRENSLCMVVNGLEPDEPKPAFHRSVPLGADLTVLSERLDGDKSGDDGSARGKPAMSSRKSSTRQPQRSSMISLQQKHLLQSHLDLIEDVAILESPYGMIVSADRSGVIYVFT